MKGEVYRSTGNGAWRKETQALASSFLKPDWTDEWEGERTHPNPGGRPETEVEPGRSLPRRNELCGVKCASESLFLLSPERNKTGPYSLKPCRPLLPS